MLKLSVPVLLVERDAGVASDEGHEDRQTDDFPIPASADVHDELELVGIGIGKPVDLQSAALFGIGKLSPRLSQQQ